MRLPYGPLDLSTTYDIFKIEIKRGLAASYTQWHSGLRNASHLNFMLTIQLLSCLASYSKMEGNLKDDLHIALIVDGFC